MNSGRIYVQSQNLFTTTKYDGLDPETQNSQSLPPLRMTSIGLQFSILNNFYMSTLKISKGALTKAMIIISVALPYRVPGIYFSWPTKK